MSVLRLALLVDLKHKVGKLVLSNVMSYNHYFRKCLKLQYRKKYGYSKVGHR
jgi:hypothetical protein